MALETVVFPMQDLFMHSSRESWYAMGGGTWAYDLGNGAAAAEEQEKGSAAAMYGDMGAQSGGDIGEMVRRRWDFPSSTVVQNVEELDGNYSTPEADHVPPSEGVLVIPPPPGGRRKRRRTKVFKNKEEVENQRMTHIAVERNRRKQMNEYLAVLRSLMPPSYVQRGDQASIIGGAINFVKELEQLLQSLEAEKRIKQQPNAASSAPFADFFSFPQYSMRSSPHSSATAPTSSAGVPATANDQAMAANHSAIADIEVTMVESHANIKVLSRRRTRQLLKMVVGLQNLRLTALHLNVTTVDEMVLYSFSVKVEDDSQLNSADEIATAVYHMLGKIQEDSSFN